MFDGQVKNIKNTIKMIFLYGGYINSNSMTLTHFVYLTD